MGPVLGGSKWSRGFAGPRSAVLPGYRVSRFNSAICLPDGEVDFTGEAAGEKAGRAFALAAGPSIPLGRFITARLPAILAALPDHEGARLAGAALTAAQEDVLDRLGLAQIYETLCGPRRFAEALICHRTPGTGAELTALAALLRDPPTRDVPAIAAILPDPDTERFALRNRSSLAAWLRARRATLLNPDDDPFAQTAAALARATALVIADAGQAGLLTLCPPGTQILEIAPEGWARAEIRSLCAALGLKWRLFLAPPPSYPLSQSLPFSALRVLSYEIPIAPLARVLGRL
jgi:hypothetical protein